MNDMIQLIGGDGWFNSSGLSNFSKIVNLPECGAFYTVVSIIGAQSSGKSTLLNHLFGTNFRMMDANYGRVQTTEGVWLAKAVGIERCTLVIDIEGCDGTERGEDDTLFERQSAIFALEVSDVILMNMFSHDVGRIKGGSLHLLELIFKNASSLKNQRKTTLLFVLRDKSKTPVEALTNDLWRSIEKIYHSVSKAEDQMENSLSLYFNIQIISLPHYELQEQEFKDQVASLRKRFISPTTLGNLVEEQSDKAPASDFPRNTLNIWKIIKDNKDLDMPTNKIMVATVLCDKIIEEMLESFARNKDRHQLVDGLETGQVKGFGRKMSTIFETCLSQYDTKTLNFDEGVKTPKRQILLDKMVKLVHPLYESLLESLYSKALKDFENTFEDALRSGKSFSAAVDDCKGSSQYVFREQCKEAEIPLAGWDSSKLLSRLEGAIDSYVTFVDARLALARAVESLELAQAEAAATKDIATKAAAEAKIAERDLAAAVAAASRIAAETKEAAEAQITIAQAENARAIAEYKAMRAEQDARNAQLFFEKAATDKNEKENLLSQALKVITDGVKVVVEIFQAVQNFKSLFGL